MAQLQDDNYLQKSLTPNNVYINNYNTHNFYNSQYDNIQKNDSNIYQANTYQNTNPIDMIPSYTPKNKNYLYEEEYEEYNSPPKNMYTPPIKQTKPIKQQVMNQQYKPINNILDLSPLEICKYSSTLARDQAGCRLLQKKMEEDHTFADEIFLYVNNINIRYQTV